jgi:hypothetical protein
MQLYTHILDLRLSHPTLDPDLVSRTLGLEPQAAWRAGDPRKTPKGTPLEGIRSGGYWSSNPFLYGWRASTDAQIEDGLEELIGFLEPHREFLLSISDAGSVELWVSSHGNRNYAIELSTRTLARLAALGATLVHDVYQGP